MHIHTLTQTLSISNMLALAPEGVIDPTPLIYDTTMYVCVCVCTYMCACDRLSVCMCWGMVV
jgi:hypothetical protein